LLERGRSLNHISELEALVRLLERFLAEQVLEGRAATRSASTNPYRYLDYYDVNDADVYVGRDRTTARAVSAVEQRLEDRLLPSMFRIDGESGCGKSSFLRAGILGRLRGARSRGRFRVAVFRPSDLRTELAVGVLGRLLELISVEHADILPTGG